MAVFTNLSIHEASATLANHGLPACEAIVPIPAGSVNSNFFVDGAFGRRFFRIYEEQESSGVAYEWALLDHLADAGLPVPRRVRSPGVRPGELRVAGKPVALFELVGGQESCQRGVSVARARAVGAFLGRLHATCSDYGWRRQGRFTRTDVARRLETAAAAGRPELKAPIAQLEDVLAEVEESWPTGLPQGVVHGDLFRDNVRWQGDEIVAAIDWESASDGELLYDVVVAWLAWCYGDTFEPELGRALFAGYSRERPLNAEEIAGVRTVALAATARFATTRITDFHLRSGSVGERILKDYRRFLARLEWVAARTADELTGELGL